MHILPLANAYSITVSFFSTEPWKYDGGEWPKGTVYIVLPISCCPPMAG